VFFEEMPRNRKEDSTTDIFGRGQTRALFHFKAELSAHLEFSMVDVTDEWNDA
jgi:hypothetical protein